MLISVLLAVGLYGLFLWVVPERKETASEEVGPPAHAVVSNTDGSPQVVGETGDTRSVQAGDTVSVNEEVRTRNGESLQLQFHQVAVMELSDSSNLRIDNLTAGKSASDDKGHDTVPEVQLDLNKGLLNTHVKNNRDLQLKLEMERSVAGIRGTTFQCETQSASGDRCSVSDGEVQYSSRSHPDRLVRLTSGQQSSVGANDTAPVQPEPIDTGVATELDQFRREARNMLELAELISGDSVQIRDLTVNDSPVRPRLEVTYSDSVPTFRVRGTALVGTYRETIDDVFVRIGGTIQEVKADTTWSLTIRPGEMGDTTGGVKVEVGFTTPGGNTAVARTFRLNPKRTKSPTKKTEVPPHQMSIDRVGSINVREFDFPYTVYGVDFPDTRLNIRGSVRSETASSLDFLESSSLRVIAGDYSVETSPVNPSWSIDIQQPDTVFEVVSELTGPRGQRRSSDTVGPFRPRVGSLEQDLKDDARALFRALESGRAEGIQDQLHPDFTMMIDGKDTDVTVGELVRDYHDQWENVNIDMTVSNVRASRSTGRVFVSVQWEADSAGGTGSQFARNVLTVSETTPLIYRRDSQGEYRLKQLGARMVTREEPPSSPETTENQPDEKSRELLNSELVTERRFTLNHRDGINVFQLTKQANQSKSVSDPHDGHFIVGLKGETFEWKGDTPTLYLNNGEHTFCTGYYCYQFPVQDGAVEPVEISAGNQVENLENIGEGKRWADRVVLRPGWAFQFYVRTGAGRRTAGVIRVENVRTVDQSADPSVTLQIRTVTSPSSFEGE